MILDGEDFILQVHGVFTRICSGASLVASSGGARACATTAQQQGLGWMEWARSIGTTLNVGNGTP
jgi:hypothetical protein